MSGVKYCFNTTAIFDTFRRLFATRNDALCNQVFSRMKSQCSVSQTRHESYISSTDSSDCRRWNAIDLAPSATSFVSRAWRMERSLLCVCVCVCVASSRTKRCRLSPVTVNGTYTTVDRQQGQRVSVGRRSARSLLAESGSDAVFLARNGSAWELQITSRSSIRLRAKPPASRSAARVSALRGDSLTRHKLTFTIVVNYIGACWKRPSINCNEKNASTEWLSPKFIRRIFFYIYPKSDIAIVTSGQLPGDMFKARWS